jgi:hypothetical protein
MEQVNEGSRDLKGKKQYRKNMLTFASVTPLKANFMHAAAATEGELKL